MMVDLFFQRPAIIAQQEPELYKDLVFIFLWKFKFLMIFHKSFDIIKMF